MSDIDPLSNVIEFTRKKREPSLQMSPTTYKSCRHDRVGIDQEHREVKCRDCETKLDAFQVLWEMAIKERRYFVSGAEIRCHHPYWPEEAFLDHTNEGDWREKLADLNHESAEEIERLSGYARLIGAVLPEDSWSVDFAKTKDGKWYLIDMALAHESYHWPNCPKEQS